MRKIYECVSPFANGWHYSPAYIYDYGVIFIYPFPFLVATQHFNAPAHVLHTTATAVTQYLYNFLPSAHPESSRMANAIFENLMFENKYVQKGLKRDDDDDDTIKPFESIWMPVDIWHERRTTQKRDGSMHFACKRHCYRVKANTSENCSVRGAHQKRNDDRYNNVINTYRKHKKSFTISDLKKTVYILSLVPCNDANGGENECTTNSEIVWFQFAQSTYINISKMRLGSACVCARARDFNFFFYISVASCEFIFIVSVSCRVSPFCENAAAVKWVIVTR